MRTRVKSPGQNGSRERGFGSLKYERLFLEDIDDGLDLARRNDFQRPPRCGSAELPFLLPFLSDWERAIDMGKRHGIRASWPAGAFVPGGRGVSNVGFRWRKGPGPTHWASVGSRLTGLAPARRVRVIPR